VRPAVLRERIPVPLGGRKKANETKKPACRREVFGPAQGLIKCTSARRQGPPRALSLSNGTLGARLSLHALAGRGFQRMLSRAGSSQLWHNRPDEGVILASYGDKLTEPTNGVLRYEPVGVEKNQVSWSPQLNQRVLKHSNRAFHSYFGF